MSVAKTLALFFVAAVAEIGGAWLIWQGIREHRGVAWIGAGIAALAAYGFVATLQDDNNFGRILAAYAAAGAFGYLAVRRRRAAAASALGAPPIACTITASEIPERIEVLERMRANLSSLERTAQGLLLDFPIRPEIEADLRRFAVDE